MDRQNQLLLKVSFWIIKLLEIQKKEVHSWINHLIEHGHGPPTFFMTLSCAEHQWKDIERLIKQRMQMAGTDPNFFDQNPTKWINDYSIVVQEYFQKRVSFWLKTIGTKNFHIEHHWLRFEFAPSRGQIHAHMLVVCNKQFIKPLHDMMDSHPQRKTQILNDWLEATMKMTASVDILQRGKLDVHPSTQNLSEIVDHAQDQRNCQLQLQTHVCSRHCLSHRR